MTVVLRAILLAFGIVLTLHSIKVWKKQTNITVLAFFILGLFSIFCWVYLQFPSLQ